MLQHEQELSVSEMAEMQLDSTNAMAAALVPYLLDIDDLPSDYYRQAQDLLLDWDFTQPADSAPAAYFNAVWRSLLAKTFHDDLREGSWPDGESRWFQVMQNLIEHPASHWWDDADTSAIETRDDIMLAALVEARDELTKLRSRDPNLWKWGELHTLNLRSATLGESGIAPVERLFNRTGWQVGGGASVVDASGWDPAEGYEVNWAPSMRMVVSLADWDASRWINLTGVSGHPASAHYSDQTRLWAEGQSLPWVFSREQVGEAGEDTLILTP